MAALKVEFSDPIAMQYFCEAELAQALAGISVVGAEQLFSKLALAYSEPQRYYHGCAHIESCLRLLAGHAEQAERLAEIALAFWFHDAVYDTQRNDNEAQSAQWAVSFLSGQGADPVVVARIESMILATQTHQVSSPDSALMMDIDLAVLAANDEVFDRYDSAIRQEYSWVADADYRQGRAAVLNDFLSRDKIYHSPCCQHWEVQARANLQRALSALAD